jgi:hypothetical protein
VLVETAAWDTEEAARTAVDTDAEVAVATEADDESCPVPLPNP